jgi:hypothetical protein
MQTERIVALFTLLPVIALQYIPFDAADPRNKRSFSFYTGFFLSQHLARSTARTKIQALCKIATSTLLCHRLSSWLIPILLTWIKISRVDDTPSPWPLSVATVALWVIWAFSTFRRVQENKNLSSLLISVFTMAFNLFEPRVSR